MKREGEAYDVSRACAYRARTNMDRRIKRFKKGAKSISVMTRLRQLESALYWYRNTVETSHEVCILLGRIPSDIKYYQKRENERAKEK